MQNVMQMFALNYMITYIHLLGTHDGSIAHVRKHEQQGWIDLEKAFLASDRVAQIDQLQVSNLSCCL